jgi:hypothetical protein
MAAWTSTFMALIHARMLMVVGDAQSNKFFRNTGVETTGWSGPQRAWPLVVTVPATLEQVLAGAVQVRCGWYGAGTWSCRVVSRNGLGTVIIETSTQAVDNRTGAAAWAPWG